MRKVLQYFTFITALALLWPAPSFAQRGQGNRGHSAPTVRRATTSGTTQPVRPSYTPPSRPSYSAPSRSNYTPPSRPSYSAPSRSNYTPPSRPSYSAPSRSNYTPPSRTHVSVPVQPRSNPSERSTYSTSNRSTYSQPIVNPYQQSPQRYGPSRNPQVRSSTPTSGWNSPSTTPQVSTPNASASRYTMPRTPSHTSPVRVDPQRQPVSIPVTRGATYPYRSTTRQPVVSNRQKVTYTRQQPVIYNTNNYYVRPNNGYRYPYSNRYYNRYYYNPYSTGYYNPYASGYYGPGYYQPGYNYFNTYSVPMLVLGFFASRPYSSYNYAQVDYAQPFIYGDDKAYREPPKQVDSSVASTQPTTPPSIEQDMLTQVSNYVTSHSAEDLYQLPDPALDGEVWKLSLAKAPAVYAIDSNHYSVITGFEGTLGTSEIPSSVGVEFFVDREASGWVVKDAWIVSANGIPRAKRFQSPDFPQVQTWQAGQVCPFTGKAMVPISDSTAQKDQG